MKRVVVTGLGVVTPFGFGVDVLWDSLLANKNGISRITDYKVQGGIASIAGSMPIINDNIYREKGSVLFKRIPEDESVKSFFLAVYDALNNAGLDLLKLDQKDRTGAFIADRPMPLVEYIDQYARLLDRCVDENNTINQNKFYTLLKKIQVGKRSFFNDPDSINHLVSRNYSITGPQISSATACASGNTAIGEAFMKIKQGYIDAAITGGAYNYSLNSLIGFTRIAALTTSTNPESACCPFDEKRSGFVMGSGCGILIIEELEFAKKRGACILAEIKGYGYSSDAFRSTDPDPDAKGCCKAVRQALEMAQLNTGEIDYINAHGTSTKMNDLTETRAIKNVFKDYAYNIPISSTKSMIGHSIMAAAAIEGIVCVKSINNNIMHPNRNWENRDPELDLYYIPDNRVEEKKLYNVLSNSFGFGGQNTSIIYSKFNG